MNTVGITHSLHHSYVIDECSSIEFLYIYIYRKESFVENVVQKLFYLFLRLMDSIISVKVIAS